MSGAPTALEALRAWDPILDGPIWPPFFRAGGESRSSDDVCDIARRGYSRLRIT
jgi:hypothetical protein